MDRPEQVGGLGEVLQRELEERLLLGLAALEPVLDGLVVIGAVLDGVVEDRRVGGQPGDRELVDIATQQAGLEHVARDVVEPQALAQIVQGLRGFHAAPLVLMHLAPGADRRCRSAARPVHPEQEDDRRPAVRRFRRRNWGNRGQGRATRYRAGPAPRTMPPRPCPRAGTG